MRLAVVFSALLLLVLSGCAFPIYVVGNHGPAHEQELDPGTTICVEKASEAAGSELDSEVSSKLETMLEIRGFEPAEAPRADYYLFYDYRVKALMNVSRFQPTSGGTSGIETVRREGPFVHTLTLRLAKGDPFRERGEEHVIWTGGGVFNDVPTASTKFHDMLLVAAFELFPQDVEEAVRMKLVRGDPRTAQLRDRWSTEQ
jgi:hypothetical protein